MARHLHYAAPDATITPPRKNKRPALTEQAVFYFSSIGGNLNFAAFTFAFTRSAW